MAMSNAGFNAVSGHTFAICPIEAHWCGCRTSHTKPTKNLEYTSRTWALLRWLLNICSFLLPVTAALISVRRSAI
ncbi:hypothetical protein HaLaN_32976 [Haematococcus lacustris]|uniref:Uncharacterized protein n=1 Tax=Haematococcus lacustris TaxID=44745 RepID=A0A6A0AMX5_HAELA|nr:hypothetical protein HaLaN_32976 [Haematococcus lacustris]